MTVKTQLHPNNLHKKGYDFEQLCRTLPALKQFVQRNKYQNLSIDFANPNAVKTLNHALLAHFYAIEYWDIPKGFLCPPIPGRVDYIHYLADLLNSEGMTKDVKVLDIGTGASCIYPILGQRSYQWSFVATDIDPQSIKNSQHIIARNDKLADNIECRLQTNAHRIFDGVIKPEDRFHLTMCNPPFHGSLEQAMVGSQRKWENLSKTKSGSRQAKPQPTTLNFGGQKAELWCEGGERGFITNMIKESKKYAQQVRWFTCLVSQKDNIRPLKLVLKKQKATQSQVIKMAQGQKISRFIAWRFQS